MTGLKMIDYIGNCPIYGLCPSYIHFDLPFHVYDVRTPHWTGEINVSTAFLHYYDERLAVALTAWGEIKERFGTHLNKICARHGREVVRDAFIKSLTFERRW
jgi:hypothetical protein